MRRLLARLALVATAFAPIFIASNAHAFCGFYVAPDNEQQALLNDASMVALMREGTRTVISMSNNYKGPATDFAMVVPVPVVLQKENVKTLGSDVFMRLETLSAPRLVEYWEQDPCPHPQVAESSPSPISEPDECTTSMSASTPDSDYGVRVEAQFSVGEYEIVVLSATQSDGLESWLHDHKYKIPEGASAALAPYIQEQQKFFVARVDIHKVQMDAQGVAVLSPLRFSYESQDFRLPVRLGLLNAPANANGATSAAKQDLLIFVLSKDNRYEVANYPNVYVPTNLEVTDATKAKFAQFYAALFDASVAKWQGKGIVTEYAWQTTTCDPCPSPPLEDQDIATLGGDALFGGSPGAMILTRLHARYDASTLSEDLIFHTAEPIVGGRETWDANGAIEKGARPDTMNNFQARYVIRHAWEGPIDCEKPQRGIWGGPSGNAPTTMPATNLAAAPRGEVRLGEFLKDSALEFVIVPPIKTQLPRACGCELPGSIATQGGTIAAFSTLAALMLILRRRR